MQPASIPTDSREALSQWYRTHADGLERSLDQLRGELGAACTQRGLRPTLKWRVKSFKSLYAKVLRTSSQAPASASERVVPTDLLGMRLVLPFLEDLRHGERLIEGAFNVVERQQRGGRRHEFGYESTHYLVTVPAHIADAHGLDGQLLCEIQLRTILQEAWAEVEHELVYKAEFNPFDEPLRRKLVALNANLALSDIVFQEARAYQRQLQRQLKRRRATFTTMMLRQGEPYRGSPAAPASGETAATQDGDQPDRIGAMTLQPPPEEDFPQYMIPAGGATIDNMLLYALHAHNRGDVSAALSIYGRILQIEDRGNLHAIVRIHRGMAHVADGDYHSALMDFSEAIALNPQSPKGYFHRALVHQFENRLNEARDDLQRCLALDPTHTDALLSRSRLHFDQGRFEAAMRDCDEALALEPDWQQAHAWRRHIVRTMGL